jgi:hypothetical protein
MPKLLSNKSDTNLNNLEGWEKYIKICLEENDNLYVEFEICFITGKTVLSIFNTYRLLNISKMDLLQVIKKIMKEKSLEYLISTRAKTDSYNYFVIVSIINK